MNTIKLIEKISSLHPAINTVGSGDVFNLNDRSKTKYPVMWLDLQAASIEYEHVTPTVRVYYIDRMLDDKTNQMDIQTDSMYILNQIMASLSELVAIPSPLRITTFQQRFTDMCAGGYIDIPVKECALQDENITIPVSTPAVFGYWIEDRGFLKPKNSTLKIESDLIEGKFITLQTNDEAGIRILNGTTKAEIASLVADVNGVWKANGKEIITQEWVEDNYALIEDLNDYKAIVDPELLRLEQDKLNKATFDSYETQTDLELARLEQDKLDENVFDDYEEATDAELTRLNNEKLDTSVYLEDKVISDAELLRLETDKLDKSVFEPFQTSTNTELARLELDKLDEDDFETYKFITNAELVRLETEKLDKTTFDSYETQTNDELQRLDNDKLDKSIYNSDKIISDGRVDDLEIEIVRLEQDKLDASVFYNKVYKSSEIEINNPLLESPSGVAIKQDLLNIELTNSIDALKPWVQTNFAKIGGDNTQNFTVKDLTVHGTVNHWLGEVITIENANLQLNATEGGARTNSGLIIYDVTNTTELSKLYYDTNNRWRLDSEFIATESYVGNLINGLPDTIDWSMVTSKPTWLSPTTKSAFEAAHSHTWGQVTGKPTTFNPSAHNQAISTITGLQGELDKKVDKITGFSLMPNTEIIRLSTVYNQDISGKADKSQVLTNVPLGALFTDTVYTAGSGISIDASTKVITNTSPNVVQTTITGNAGSATKLQTARNINGVSFDGTKNITIVDSTKEPSFTKNSAFNKNFGTKALTVAQGNDSRINNGQTAFEWGNHASIDYARKTQNETITGSWNIAALSTTRRIKANYDEYSYRWGGSTDLEWKKVATLNDTVASGYKGITGTLIVYDNQGNHGNNIVKEVKAHFRTYFYSNSNLVDSCVLRLSKDAESYIRIIKHGVNNYELQIRQIGAHRSMGAILKIHHNLSNSVIHTSLTNGGTGTGIATTSIEDYFGNLTANNGIFTGLKIGANDVATENFVALHYANKNVTQTISAEWEFQNSIFIDIKNHSVAGTGIRPFIDTGAGRQFMPALLYKPAGWSINDKVIATEDWVADNFAPLTPSDVRLKENIQTMPSALESVNRLRPVSFNYKSDKSKKEQYGFIAQELREDFPQFVGGKEAEDEYLNVDYASVVVPLTKAVQELTAMVSAMQEEINKLKNGI